MEGIVVGFAQINFHQNLNEVKIVNSVPYSVNNSTTVMSVCDSLSTNSENDTSVNEQETDISSDPETDNSFNSLNDSRILNDSMWEEIAEEDLASESPKTRVCTLAERRQMPRRSAKESSLSGVKHRTKMKPAKRTKSQEDFKNLKPSQIKKIYLNKKLTKFKPSCLETIYEEASTSHNTEENLNLLMGERKIRRSLSLPDGFKCNKTLLNKRRAKIKKTFGKRFALKKISFEEFIAKLNNSVEKTENDAASDCCMDNQKPVSQAEILSSNTSHNTHDIRNCYLPNLSGSLNNMSP